MPQIKPPIIVTKQRERRKQTIKATESMHANQGHVEKKIAVRRPQSIDKIPSGRIPELLEKESKCKRHETPAAKLRKLLEFAKSSETVHHIVKSDLEDIVACFNYHGHFPNIYPFTSKEKLKKLSILILSYLAQHRKIPEEGIKALINELKKKNLKLMPSIILALSHAINNDQVLRGKQKRFTIAVRSLVAKKDELAYLPIIVIALSALIKLGEKLRPVEWEILKCALLDPQDDKQVLYLPSCSVKKYSTDDNFFWYSRNASAELKYLKNKSKSRRLLTKKELRYTEHQWFVGNEKIKITVSEILKFAVINHQRRFPEPEKLLSILKQGLADNERKIKYNILVIISYLLRNKELKEDFDLTYLSNALAYQRKYALEALSQAISSPATSGLPNLEEWKTVLHILKENSHKEVSKMAIFILLQIENNFENLVKLEPLLLDKENCLITSKKFCDAALSKHMLSMRALENLVQMIVDDFPLDAQINAAIAISYAAENSQIFADSITQLVISLAQRTVNEDLDNALLTAVGHLIANNFRINYLNAIVNLCLMSFNNAKKHEANSFILANILQQITLDSQSVNLNKALYKVTKILSNEHDKINENTLNNFILILYTMAEKNLPFHKFSLKNIGDFLKKSASKDRRLAVLKILQKIIENNDRITFPDNVVDFFIVALDGELEIPIYDVMYFLTQYIKKSTKPLSLYQIENISVMLKNLEHVATACTLIKNMVQMNWILPVSVLNQLSDVISDLNPDVRLEILVIFREIVEIQELPHNIILKVQMQLSDLDEETIEHVVAILLKSTKHTTIYITEQATQYLAEIACRTDYNYDIRVDTLTLLAILSNKNTHLSISVLDLLESLMNQASQELQVLIIQTLCYQIKYCKSFIVNHNTSIINILAQLENNLNNTELAEIIVPALSDAQKYGYQLTSDTYDLMAEIVLNRENKFEKISNLAYTIIRKAKAIPLSEKISQILELENDSQVLNTCFKPSCSQCNNALEHLATIASNGDVLTYNNIATIERILTLDNLPYLQLNKILNISLVVARNKQKFSKAFIYLLKNIIKSTFDEVSILAARTCAEIIINEETISDECTDLFEWLVSESARVYPSFLQALEYASKTNRKFSDETIKRLQSLLHDDNSEIRHSSARVILNLIDNFIFDASCFDINYILQILLSSKDKILNKNLCLIVKNSITYHVKSLHENFIKKLVENIETTNESFIRKNLIDALFFAGDKLPIANEIKQFIIIKKIERDFTSPETSLDEKLFALKSLRACGKNLANDTLNAIAKLLLDVSIQDQVLDVINSLQEEIILPPVIYQSLNLIVTNKTSLTGAMRTLLLIAKQRKKLPIFLQNTLINIVLHDDSEENRGLSYTILHELDQEQLDSNIRQLINIEIIHFDMDEEKQSKWLTLLLYAIKNNAILSINNCNVLLKLLESKNTFILQQVVDVIDAGLDNFSPEFFEKIIRPMIKLLNNNKLIREQITIICISILNSGYVSLGIIRSIKAYLENEVGDKNINLQQLEIIAVMARKYEFGMNENFIEILITALLNSKDENLQLAVINVLFEIIKSNDEYSSRVILKFERLSKILQHKLINIAYIEKPEVSRIGRLFNTVFDTITTWGQSIENNYSSEVQAGVCLIFGYLFRHNQPIFSSLETTLSLLSEHLINHINVGAVVLNKIKVLESKKQLNLMLIIASSSFYNDKIIEDLSDEYLYGREVICNDIFNYAYDEIHKEAFFKDRQQFYDILVNLEESQDCTESLSNEINNILILILDKQIQNNLSLKQINQILFQLLIHKPLVRSSYKTIINDLTDLKLKWLHGLLNRHVFKSNVDLLYVKKIELFLDLLEWDYDVSEEFIKKIGLVKNVDEIISFFDFYVDYGIDNEIFFVILSSSVSDETHRINYWQTELQKNLIFELVDILTEKLNNNKKSDFPTRNLIYSRAHNLMSKGWSFDKIYQLLKEFLKHEKITDPSHFQFLYSCFDFVYYYGIPEEIFDQLYLNNSWEKLPQALHKFIVDTHFDINGHIKKRRNLLIEFDELNNQHAIDSEIQVRKNALLSSQHINLILTQIDNCYINQGPFLSHFKPLHAIKYWSPDDIKLWAKHVMPSHAKNPLCLVELLAVIKRAYFVFSGDEVRTTQLISLLTFIYREPNLGRLTQNKTGEGKSAIIAMFAVIQALQGEPVDITTISTILAIRDVKIYQPFYDLFNLNAASNEDNKYTHGPKKCYQSHIVYGTIDNFQFDYLRHVYSDLGTRGTRSFETLIIDESDNVLIEGSRKIAMLSSTVPGMESLQPLLVALWQKLESLDACLQGEDLNTFSLMVDGVLTTKINKHEVVAIELLKYAKSITAEGAELILFPNYLKKFIENQIPKWVDSAITAYYIQQLGHHYRIKSNKYNIPSIVPVDFDNTGVSQNDTSWGDGLHQFLQIKHGLKISSEAPVTNFLSNMAYVELYGHKIYGLTGTLGSPETKKLLSEVYEVDTFEIPIYKENQRMELPGIIAPNRTAWEKEIIISALREGQCGRVVLVVLESINQANAIYESLSKQYSGKIRLYTDSDSEQNNFIDDVVESGTIIIATNLAGRGTDIKFADNVIKEGGVSVTGGSLSPNSRIADQLSGRAGRKGLPGTVQLILNQEDLENELSELGEYDLSNNTIKRIKQLRDEKEKISLKNLQEKEIIKIKNKDNLFKKFIVLLKDLSDQGDINHIYKRAAVEEHWAFWLKECDCSRESNIIENEFQLFRQNVLDAYMNDTIITNPHYYLWQGNDCLAKASTFKGFIFQKSHYKNAYKAFSDAIALDPNGCFIAYYYRAYTLIKLAKNNYKELAKIDLQKANQILFDHIIPQQRAINQLIMKSNPVVENELFKQLFSKDQVLLLIHDSIEQALEQLQHSQKFVDITFHTSKSDLFYDHLLDNEKMLNLIDHNLGEITLTFHNLRVNQDTTTSYESLNTLFRGTNENGINVIFNSNSFSRQENVNVELKKLLPINQEKITEEITKPEENSKAEKEEVAVGVYENSVKLVTKIREKASNAGNKVSNVAHAAIKKAKKPVAHLFDKTKYYEKAKLLPVTITLSAIAKPVLCLKLEPTVFEQGKIYIEQLKDCLRYTVITAACVKNTGIITYHELPIHIDITSTIDDINPILTNIQKIIAEKGHAEPVNEAIFFELDLLSRNEVPVSNLKMMINHLNKEMIEKINAKIPNAKFTINTSSQNPEPIDVDSGQRKLFKNISKLKNNVYYDLSFDNLTTNDCHLIINAISGTNLHYLITFPALSQQHADKILDLANGNITLAFDELNKSDAKAVAYLLHKKKIHDRAIFQLTKLSCEQAKSVIKNADRSDNGFNINHNPIAQELQKLNVSRSEWVDYKNNGFQFLYDIDQKNKFPIKSIALLIGLAVLQIAGGVALFMCTSGFGANVSIGLMSDGLNDLIRAATCSYKRDFNLTSYLLQKSASISMNLITAGFSSLVSSQATTIKNVTDLAANYADETILYGSDIFMRVQTVWQLKRAGINLGINALQTATSSAVNASAKLASDFGLQKLKPIIAEKISADVELLFADGYLTKVLYHAFIIDKFLKSHSYQRQITTEAKAIINNMQLSLISANVNPCDLEKFKNQFKVALEKIEESFPTFEIILANKLRLDLDLPKDAEDFQNIIKFLVDYNILKKDGHINAQALPVKDDISDINDLSNFDVSIFDLTTVDVDEVFNICRSYDFALSDNPHREKLMLCKEVTSYFSDNITQALKIVLDASLASIAQTANFGISKAGQMMKGFAEANLASGANDLGDLENISKSTPRTQHSHRGHRKNFQPAEKPVHRHQRDPNKLLRGDHQPKPSTIPGNHAHTRSHLEEQQRWHRHSHPMNQQRESWAKPSPDRNDIVPDHHSHHPHSIVRARYAKQRHFLKQPHRHKNFHAQPFRQSTQTAHVNSVLAINSTDTTGIKLFKQSITSIRNIALIEYQQALKAYENKKIYLLEKSENMYLEEKTAQYKKIKSMKAKAIKTLIALIILDLQLTKDTLILQNLGGDQKFIHPVKYNHEEIIKKAKIIFNQSKKQKNAYAYTVSQLKLIAEIHDETSSFLQQLKDSFNQYEQLSEETNMLDLAKGVIDKTDMNTIMGQFFKSAEDRNYNQCGLLLRDGKMGEAGFLAGTMIEGLIKCQLSSTAAHSRMQVMLIELAKKVVEQHTHFENQVTKIYEEQQKLLATFRDVIDKKLDRAYEMFGKLVDSNKTEFIPALESLIRLTEASFGTMQKICEANGMPADFVANCTKISSDLMATMLDTVKVLAKNDTDSFKALLDMGKETIIGLVGKKDKNPDAPAIAPALAAAPAAQALVAPVADAAPALAAVPAWKKDFNEGTALFRKGKFNFKKGPATYENAYTFFQEAKDSYKAALAEGDIAEAAKLTINKRLAKLKDDGKYSPAKMGL